MIGPGSDVIDPEVDTRAEVLPLARVAEIDLTVMGVIASVAER